MYEDRSLPQPEVDDEDAGWMKIAELDPATGQPMPGTVPTDAQDALRRAGGWTPIDQFRTSGR